MPSSWGSLEGEWWWNLNNIQNRITVGHFTLSLVWSVIKKSSRPVYHIHRILLIFFGPVLFFYQTHHQLLSRIIHLFVKLFVQFQPLLIIHFPFLRSSFFQPDEIILFGRHSLALSSIDWICYYCCSFWLFNRIIITFFYFSSFKTSLLSPTLHFLIIIFIKIILCSNFSFYHCIISLFDFMYILLFVSFFPACRNCLHWSLSYNKPSQLSRIILSITTDFNTFVV